MGLDSYVFKITKPKTIKGMVYENIKDWDLFPSEVLKERRCRQIRPYCSRILISPRLSYELGRDGFLNIKEMPNQPQYIYVCKMDEVKYWRKDFKIRSWFYNHIKSDMENTGYYRLTPKVIRDFNNEFEPKGFKLPNIIPTKTSALFYYEWY